MVTAVPTVLFVLTVLAAGGCAQQPTSSPADRTVAVVTNGCGAAPSAVGSGVRLEGHLVLTAAHVVAGSEEVGVLSGADLPEERDWPAFSAGRLFSGSTEASVVALDRARDLALLAVDGTDTGQQATAAPATADAKTDDSVWIHGVADPGRARAEVAERTVIVADEVRESGRVRRDGYRLDATTRPGDSGAGVWTDDGRLVGVVFAVSSDDDSRTWAVASSEIDEFLETHRDVTGSAEPGSFRCNRSTSRLEPER